MSLLKTDETNKNQVTFSPTHVKVFEALFQVWVQSGYAPLLREIADTTELSQRTVQRVIADLLAAGSVEKLNNRMRGYKPLIHPKEIALK